MVGYKTSLFNILTPKWLLIRPHGDFLSDLITSLPRYGHDIHENLRAKMFEKNLKIQVRFVTITSDFCWEFKHKKFKVKIQKCYEIVRVKKDDVI